MTPQQPLVLYFEQHRDSIIWYWSVVAAGGVPALLPPPKGGDNARMRELDHVSQLFKHPNALTTKATATQFVANGGFDVFCTDELPERDVFGMDRNYVPWTANTQVKTLKNEICTILFTSGSTGPSKAVSFTHQQLLASSYLKCVANGMSAHHRFLCWICRAFLPPFLP